ncbi:MAG: ACP phosphodiesterase [Draconibacterium sp.]|nr:MAG: ACP phosphodiesterase [Draconibacterium sp.]
MNYLAHLYLSGKDEKVLTGNFIGDYVKGRQIEQYPEKIKKGILLHRHIDSFTDKHPKAREAKDLLRKPYRLYSGIIVDFFYDHFLAANWEKYANISLHTFANRCHATLLANFRYLPPQVKGFLPSLIRNRRLEAYASIDGIIQSITIMSKYTSLPDYSVSARRILIENYTFLSENFELFMTEIIRYITENQKVTVAFSGHSQMH